MRTLLQNHQRNASMRHDDVRGTTASDLPTRAHPPGLPPRASRAMGLHPAKRRLGRHASKAACRHTPCRARKGRGDGADRPGALQMPPQRRRHPSSAPSYCRTLRGCRPSHAGTPATSPARISGSAPQPGRPSAPFARVTPLHHLAPAHHHHRAPRPRLDATTTPRPDRHHATIKCGRSTSQFPIPYGSESSAALNE